MHRRIFKGTYRAMVTVTGGGGVAPGIGLPMKGRPSRSTACCATTCVIYDGRVGAALGLLTRQFCEATGHTEVPSALEFAFGTPKEARNTKNTKVRDPSHGPLRFPRLDRMLDFTPFRRGGQIGFLAAR